MPGSISAGAVSPAGSLPESPTSSEPRFGLLMQLEDLPAAVRRLAFELLRDALGQRGRDLPPVLFSRYGLRAGPDFYLADVLEAVGLRDEPLETFLPSFKADLEAALDSPRVQLDAALAALIDEARQRQMAVGVLSGLAQPTAEKLMDRLGLKERGVSLHVLGDVEAYYPRADSWLKVAKAVGLSARACLVLAGHAQACRAALAAGMHVVVVPDEFTSFQDFGGADRVLERLDEVSPQELLDTILVRAR